MKEFRIDKVEKKITELKKELEYLKKRGSEDLKAIQNGASFGYPDTMDMMGGIFFCEFIEVIDAEKFIIKVKDVSLRPPKVQVDDVFSFSIL